MDWRQLKNKIPIQVGKYKYVILVILLGLALMSIPPVSQTDTVDEADPIPNEQNMAEKLEDILGKIEGVGKVRVMLTQASAEETVYQQDEDRSNNGDIRLETVIISDENRSQQGMIRTVTPPTYLGAVIVCQGAQHDSVKLAVVQAVASLTGIGTDRIIVLKMK